MLNRQDRVLWMVALVCAAPWAGAAELLLADGARVAGQLVAINQSHVVLDAGGRKQQFALADVVRWGGLAKRVDRPTVVLKGGSRVVASPGWSRQGSIRLEEDRWRLVNNTLRSIEAPRHGVRAIWWRADPRRERRVRLWEESLSMRGDDRLWLTSGDQLDGRLLGITDRTATFQSTGEEVEIESARLQAVGLASDTAEVQPHLAIGLSDGSLLYAETCTLQESVLSVRLSGGIQASGRAAESIVFLQPLAGAAIYLSDLTPLDYRHAPYFGVPRPLITDRGHGGDPLQVGGTRVLKGLAMRSASRVVYRLDQSCERFESEIGIDHSSGDHPPGGSVVFSVLVARGGAFDSAYESTVIRAGQPPRPVSVDVRGAEAIALLVDYADYGDTQDHADWLDARLIKSR